MKVALLTHEGGGISSVTYGLATSLSKMNVDTTLFSTSTDLRTSAQRINNYLKIVRLPIIDCPPRYLWFNLINFRKIYKMLNEYNIVHAVSPEMVIAYSFYKRGLRRPIITTYHGSYKAALKAFIHSPLKAWSPSDFALHVLELPQHEMVFRRSFTQSKKVVVCSYKTLRELESYNSIRKSKVSVIYNGINFNEIQRVKTEKDEMDNERFTLIYAGRLFWMKGITFALQAYENLAGEFKNLHLKIYGRGPHASKIRKYIVERKSDDKIHFGGFIPHQSLIKEIKKSDAVIFPSLYESQPMFVLESMACRKPVIAFDLPYAREIIKDGETGLLAKPYNTESLVKKIEKVISEKELRLKIGENAQKYVEKNHNWDTQAEKYLKLYHEADSNSK